MSLVRASLLILFMALLIFQASFCVSVSFGCGQEGWVCLLGLHCAQVVASSKTTLEVTAVVSSGWIDIEVAVEGQIQQDVHLLNRHTKLSKQLVIFVLHQSSGLFVSSLIF